MGFVKMLKIFLFALFFFFSSFSFANASVGEFRTNYNVVYRVNNDGITFVDQEIALTNRLTGVYATETVITLGSENIFNISAYDNIGKIYIKVDKNNKETKVHAFFNEKVVGAGKTYRWHLRYETPDLVFLNGLIKEINLPKLAPDSDIETYTLAIEVPEEFGKLLYIKPYNDKKQLFFNKEELSENQINIVFGQNQIFNFKLNYHLKNPQITTVLTELALPPDTQFQTIYLHSLLPEPERIELDSDGNWLAKYRLLPQESIDVVASGSAKIEFLPKYQEKISSFSNLNYLTFPQKYWEANDPGLKELAKTLKTPKAIYDFVTSKLQYSYERVKDTPIRYGAKYILENPQKAICMEFTDLFIALARGNGIMAREIDGYAYTVNPALMPLSLEKDILHSWPEYYDSQKQVWVPVDPTWGNTTSGVDFFHTFDLNHLVFVKRGKNSEYPYPAGAYKNTSVLKKDIGVVFGKPEDLVVKENIILNLKMPAEIYSGVPSSFEIEIINKGNTMLSKSSITLAAKNLLVKNPILIDVDQIPPFGRFAKKVDFETKPGIKNTKGELSAYYLNYKQIKEIQIKPLPFLYLIPLLAVFLLILLVSILIIKTKWKKF